MARPKKTTAKKTTARGRKATPKAKAARTTKVPTTKEEMSDHLKTQTAEIKMLKSTPSTKRPPSNPDVPKTIIEMLNHDFGAIKEMLDNFAQHLRALDRMRLNGVGIKKQGFIRRTERGRGRACTDMTERVRTRRA